MAVVVWLCFIFVWSFGFSYSSVSENCIDFANVAINTAGPVKRTYKNCAEIRLAGFQDDGLYYIDIDGPGFGKAPIEVYCKLSDLSLKFLGFAGQSITTFKSCQEIRNAGYMEDGYYYIDPDGFEYLETPREVYCNLTHLHAKKKQIRNCQEMKNAGATENGFYDFYLNAPSSGKIRAFCNFNETSSGITEFHHDSMTDVTVNGFEGSQEYHRKIKYAENITKIREFMQTASECQQYFRYNCMGSHLSDNGAWLTWDGRKQTYWNQQNMDKLCWCGVNGTCAGQTSCECDNNDYVPRVDKGTLMNMDDLPIIALYFGDTGDSTEFGVHYLGPLQCFNYET